MAHHYFQARLIGFFDVNQQLAPVAHPSGREAHSALLRPISLTCFTASKEHLLYHQQGYRPEGSWRGA